MEHSKGCRSRTCNPRKWPVWVASRRGSSHGGTVPPSVYAVSSSTAVNQKPAKENTTFSPKISGIPYQVYAKQKYMNLYMSLKNVSSPKNTFFIVFRERVRKRERDINVRGNVIGFFLVCTLTKNQTHNLGMFPDWESNP